MKKSLFYINQVDAGCELNQSKCSVHHAVPKIVQSVIENLLYFVVCIF